MTNEDPNKNTTLQNADELERTSGQETGVAHEFSEAQEIIQNAMQNPEPPPSPPQNEVPQYTNNLEKVPEPTQGQDAQPIPTPVITQKKKTPVMLYAIVLILAIAFLLYFLFFKGDSTMTLSANSIPSTIEIPNNVDTLIVEVDTLSFIYTKEEEYDYKGFLVVSNELTDEIDELFGGLFSTVYLMLPYAFSDNDAIDIILKAIDGERPQAPKSPKEREILDQVGDIIDGQKAVGIIPASYEVANAASNVEVEDIISVTGTYFRMDRVEDHGEKVKGLPIRHMIGILYATEIDR